MKRHVIAAALVGSLALVGCGAHPAANAIKGDVGEVVEACQDLSSEGATATVNGDLGTWLDIVGETTSEPGQDMAVSLYDADSGCVVLCKFQDVTQDEIDRVNGGGEASITGDVELYAVSEDSVTLIDCEFA